MLNKSKGRILRVSAALHVLFNMHPKDQSTDESEENSIAYKAIFTAINFVEVCCQQTAYMAGQNDIWKYIQLLKAS